ncbi:hypothetical protein L2E82_30872 [Cichorium intybus]|uniref:Uncharacterized protein n=1 Tax=Cichorium intybus TaxID=13427 RepID=A0ACB9D1V8_CICIN|nr:hypothetical protein L2E82_30872 [Cichorium intybus]
MLQANSRFVFRFCLAGSPSALRPSVIETTRDNFSGSIHPSVDDHHPPFVFCNRESRDELGSRVLTPPPSAIIVDCWHLTPPPSAIVRFLVLSVYFDFSVATTSLSQNKGFNLPSCHMVNLSGFHILFDCPLDLSSLTIFSPISTILHEHTFDSSSFKKILDSYNLIPLEPYYKTIERGHLWNVSLIDVVLISSPMGMLGLPFLTCTKGFSAKIYATEATTRVSEFMMKDLITMHMEYKQLYGHEDNNFLQLMNWENLETFPSEIKDIILGKDGTELGSWMPLYS